MPFRPLLHRAPTHVVHTWKALSKSCSRLKKYLSGPRNGKVVVQRRQGVFDLRLRACVYSQPMLCCLPHCNFFSFDIRAPTHVVHGAPCGSPKVDCAPVQQFALRGLRGTSAPAILVLFDFPHRKTLDPEHPCATFVITGGPRRFFSTKILLPRQAVGPYGAPQTINSCVCVCLSVIGHSCGAALSRGRLVGACLGELF